MFQKILIANRGEIALSIVRICKEMGIKTVAIYSTADQESLHIKFADEAVCIGPPMSSMSYLDVSRIIAAAEVTNANAIHPGYGFLSENATFARVCQAHNITFIGPSSSIIDMMGDKAAAKQNMAKVGIPTIPGSHGIVKSLEEGMMLAEEVGFPIMLKATAGGGGKGIKIVKNDEDFSKAWMDAQQEAKASFNNEALYVEKFVKSPRHIEIQVIGDKQGNVIHLSERDCSIQRRNQKLVEESPSPFITPELRKRMTETAVEGIKRIGYEGVGTMEFLVDEDHNFYFMEMNTRIQVEYPVTEAVTNFNLIKEQINIAAGMKLSARDHYYPHGHAIECRINAEDPYKGFKPSPGKITNLHIPGGRGVCVATHIYTGYTVPPYYDAMIAKLIVHDVTRAAAIAKMKRALEEFVIEGIKTTIPFHIQLMDDQNFNKGHFTTHFLETFSFASSGH